MRTKIIIASSVSLLMFCAYIGAYGFVTASRTQEDRTNAGGRYIEFNGDLNQPEHRLYLLFLPLGKLEELLTGAVYADTTYYEITYEIEEM